MNGRDFYLGPHGTKASQIEYDRLIGEWIAAGRPGVAPVGQTDLTIVELSVAYRRFATGCYQKNGQPTDTIHQVRRATELLCLKYGRTAAIEFGPLAFQAWFRKGDRHLAQDAFCRVFADVWLGASPRF